ncbi:bifunctional diguanylate cyclase/phosphodiesterase [Longispora sp. NPDC051575]|uniref:putative bifunctional diguanylate cyclase/phosphodiesterase n=1 Tax=Longispora sp. NPDC051575 TaxID=3154943 RepID=UPI003446E4C3
MSVLAHGLALSADARIGIRLTTLAGLGCAALLLTGLLTMRGGPCGWGARVRAVLDGLLVAGSGAYVVWLLILGPRIVRPPAIVTVAGATVAVVCGAGVAVCLRASQPKGPVFAVAAGAGLLSAGTFAHVLWRWAALPGTRPAGLVLWLAGVGVLVLAVVRATGESGPGPAGHAPLPRLGTGLSMLPVAAALGATLYHLVTVGPLTVRAAYAATAVAAALVGRQALTMRDARRYAAELAHREAHFRSIVAGASDVTMILDSRLDVGWLSPSAAWRLGLIERDIVARSFLELPHPEDVEAVEDVLREILAGPGGSQTRMYARILDAAGEWRDLESMISDQRHVPQVAGLVMHCRDVTDRKHLERELAKMAYADPLTGLGNRRALLRTLHDEAGGRTCTLLTLDLDGFKNVNDVRGHDVGDAVLVEVAHRLRANLRPGDVPTRLGGDEFAVLMWSGPRAAAVVAGRLLKVLNAPYRLDELTVFLSASIGLAGCRTATDVPQLLRNADMALRSAKRGGKNRVEEYDAEYAESMARRADMAQELRGAGERGELSLVFQPVLHLPDNRLVGVEALLRWRHPRLGVVEPSEFIPVAEESDLVEELGTWTLHRTCHQLSAWLRAGHDLWASVNLSTRQLHLPEFPVHLAELLRIHRLPGYRLTVEIAEHRMARDIKGLSERIMVLRGMGVRVALDDFGAGYSSLAQLRTLPVDIVKIDKDLEPLADLVVQLGQRLGLEVIVEGIEEPAQLATMAAAGCRLGQGFLLGRPMPAERLEALLEETFAHDVGQVDSGREMRQALPHAADPADRST